MPRPSVHRDRAELRGKDTAELDELIAELDVEITRTGIRGTITTSGKTVKCTSADEVVDLLTRNPAA